MIRILFPFIGDTVGGSHVSSWQLVCALREMDVEPVILLHQGNGKLESWLRDKGAEWRTLPLPILRADRRIDINAWKKLRGLWPAGKLLKDWNIDLVHGNDGRINRAWAVWTRFAGVPMVWHQRVRWTASKQVRMTMPFASSVISISKFVAKGAPPIKAPHAVIYNPVARKDRDKTECARRLRGELGVPENTLLIGCFGNAQAVKRPDTVIQAASILADQMQQPFRVVWFGDDREGLLEDLLNKAGSACPMIRLPFRSDVMSAVAGCDVVVASSERDAFGRTLVEAMSVGVPVVASSAGGHLEIVKHEQNGLLFPVGDAQACADSIVRLLREHDLRQSLIDRGWQTTNQFDPANHARKVLYLYRQLLE